MLHPAIGALVIGDEILSGKRPDAHVARVIAALAARGLALAHAHLIGDDRGRITAFLRDSFARGDIVFSFGGIGATPDDHTRQAAAAALGLPLVRHPEAVAEIERRFGERAYPHRVLMAEFPAGAAIIPNPVNRIAAFSIRHHHFLPGFPEMAHPMLEWVLDTHYPDLREAPPVERALTVYGAGESELLPLMDDNVARFPAVKLFCLPAFVATGERRLELGVRGPAAEVERAFSHLRDGVASSGFRYEPADASERMRER